MVSGVARSGPVEVRMGDAHACSGGLVPDGPAMEGPATDTRGAGGERI